MNIEDIRLETYTNSSPLVEMRITHMGTGQEVKGEGTNYHKLKTDLMGELLQKVEAKGNRATYCEECKCSNVTTSIVLHSAATLAVECPDCGYKYYTEVDAIHAITIGDSKKNDSTD